MTPTAQRSLSIRRYQLFDHDGKYNQLTDVRGGPKPEQPGGPKILIGGWGEKSFLPLIARQGDLWNIPGPPFFSLDDIARKSRLIDQHCAAIGRDPHEIDRSVQINARYDDPEGLRKDVLDLISVGINHIVIGLPMPFPDNPSQWVADEVIKPVRDRLPVDRPLAPRPRAPWTTSAAGWVTGAFH